MRGISREFCQKVKLARKDRGISQSSLAAEVGCKQSAISMFEQGDPTKLSDDVVEKLAEKFGIVIEKVDEKPSAPFAIAIEQYIPGSGFCPNRNCPSNTLYEVDGQRFYLPDRKKADPVGGKFCAFCGEILEKRCTNCGSVLHDGAICSICGNPYVV